MMENNKIPIVSIVIPARNESLHIGACIESIGLSDIDNSKYEIIVVDNGSIDATREIAKKHNAIVINYPEGQTIAAVRNKGAESAQGNVLAFLDADCVVSPDWLPRALDYLGKGIGCVGSRPVAPSSGATWVQRCWGRILPRSLDADIYVDWLSSANFFVLSSHFKKVDGFDVYLETGEDADIGFRLKKYTKILYSSKVKAYHLGEPSTLLELLQKEIWHGKCNFIGLFRHGFVLSEIKSILVPICYLLAMLFFLAGVVFGHSQIVLFSFIFIFFVPFLMTLKNVSRGQSPVFLAQCFIINTTYIIGRAYSVFYIANSLKHIIRNIYERN